MEGIHQQPREGPGSGPNPSGSAVAVPGATSPRSRQWERIAIVVLDSVGVGALPDADRYGDVGSNTLGHVAQATGAFALPNLAALGLGWTLAEEVAGIPRVAEPQGAYGRAAERSPGKDTTTGHWEMMGLILTQPFPTYPHGFPRHLIEEFSRRIGRPVLGNKPASGTVIIQELGEEHLRTGYPIVYTSADSVFQVAAHEEVIPVDELYHMCQIAREMLTGPDAVDRVIARPFTGRPGAFVRTERRRDFSIWPPRATVLDQLKKAGLAVRAVGKISDIFAGQGITQAIHTGNNQETLTATLALLQESPEPGLIFANCVDFDMLWGHRNDVAGYAKGLGEFDEWVPRLLGALGPRDAVVFTADHGCDPTTPSTDHSREYVPVLWAGPPVRPGVDLGTRSTFADLGATILAAFGLEPVPAGTSYLAEIDQTEPSTVRSSAVRRQ